jgi:hypothetical protein
MFSTIKEAWGDDYTHLEPFTQQKIDTPKPDHMIDQKHSKINDIINLISDDHTTYKNGSMPQLNEQDIFNPSSLSLIDEEIKRAFIFGIVSLIFVNMYYKQ